ncbi:MAG TPA: integrase core domain-containing protein [Candidatus Sumerlaeota bacterium]|nr:integrase core domain-containing protein [Candidatus Sumerlaeota bacterium]
MNSNFLLALLTFFAHFFMPRYNARMQFLIFQIQMLRSRVQSLKITPTPAERAELIRLGRACRHDVQGIMLVVKPETYRRWLRSTAPAKPRKTSGRPGTSPEIVRLIVSMVANNIHWGYKRVWGELRKLGFRIGLTTIREILKREGFPPSPAKSKNAPGMPWSTFVRGHMESLVAVDFFTKPIYSLTGIRTAWVLVFIHLCSRRVLASYPTFHPNESWLAQQARNATIWLEDKGVDARFLIHDRDTKFSAQFKDFWKDAGTRCLPIPPRAPRANAFVESYIGTFKAQCLNHFVCLSLDHLDYIQRTWLRYYHTERPHQGRDIGNRVLTCKTSPEPESVSAAEGKIVRKTDLGGVLAWYEREAA